MSGLQAKARNLACSPDTNDHKTVQVRQSAWCSGKFADVFGPSFKPAPRPKQVILSEENHGFCHSNR